MYLPSHHEEKDLSVLHALIQAHPLGAWVTLDDEGFNANHRQNHNVQTIEIYRLTFDLSPSTLHDKRGHPKSRHFKINRR